MGCYREHAIYKRLTSKDNIVKVQFVNRRSGPTIDKEKLSNTCVRNSHKSNVLCVKFTCVIFSWPISEDISCVLASLYFQLLLTTLGHYSFFVTYFGVPLGAFLVFGKHYRFFSYSFEKILSYIKMEKLKAKNLTLARMFTNEGSFLKK